MNIVGRAMKMVSIMFLAGGLTALACNYSAASVGFSEWLTIDAVNCIQTRNVTVNTCIDANCTSCTDKTKNVSTKRKGQPNDGSGCFGPWTSITGTMVNDTIPDDCPPCGGG
jgi:hypothetical protein